MDWNGRREGERRRRRACARASNCVVTCSDFPGSAGRSVVRYSPWCAPARPSRPRGRSVARASPSRHRCAALASSDARSNRAKTSLHAVSGWSVSTGRVIASALTPGYVNGAGRVVAVRACASVTSDDTTGSSAASRATRVGVRIVASSAPAGGRRATETFREDRSDRADDVRV